jgi:signal transduction histidine kinase
VEIEVVTADGQTYDATQGLRLPPLVRDLSIAYTALSLVAPEKVHFRYKLEGQDRDWKEVVNDRRVQYSNLPPAEYRFRVTASNNSGVWNDAGAVLEFSIAPAYYQTTAFRALCVLLFAAVLWGAWQARLRRLQRQLERTMSARVAERTRIARDLHDTLLQDFQAVLLMFQSGLKLLPDRPVEAGRKLQQALTDAIVATTTARNAVQDLRSPDVESDDLVQSLTKIADEVTREDPPAVQVSSSETPLPLKPMVRGEVYRIAAEALRNALRHAEAHKVLVDIRYDRRALRVRVRDDGVGIDDEELGNKPPARHFGLHGMRERAEAVGGRLDVLSKPGEGTLVDLNIPAAAAYAAPARRSAISNLLAWLRSQDDSMEP